MKKWQPSFSCHFKEKVFFTMGCSKKLYNVLGVFTVVIICDINRKVCTKLHKILLYLLCIFYTLFFYMIFYRKMCTIYIFIFINFLYDTVLICRNFLFICPFLYIFQFLQLYFIFHKWGISSQQSDFCPPAFYNYICCPIPTEEFLSFLSRGNPVPAYWL